MEALLNSSFFGWLWRASWEAAIVVVLIRAAQGIFAKQLTPRWRHPLWFLVVIRLVLPVSVGTPLSIFNLCSRPSTASNAAPLRTEKTRAVQGRGETSGVGEVRPLPSPVSFNWPLMWLAGTIAFSGYFAAGAWCLGRKIRGQRLVTNEPALALLEDCKQEMKVSTPLVLLETSAVKSPALLGFIRPRLLLPEGLIQSFSPAELRFIFLHELGHVKRGDILINWLMVPVLVLHWFNPLVWYAALRMRADGEAACDAVALSHAGEGENKPYGKTIIKLLERFSNPVLAPGLMGILEDTDQMKRRIRLIAGFKKNQSWPIVAISLFCVLALAVLTDAQIQPLAVAGQGHGRNAETLMQPHVIASSPRAGDSQVDSAITEISVTFDRDMAEGFSWPRRGPQFAEEFPPSRDGQTPYWRDRRTCVLPVKLQPGHFYRVSINSEEFQNFQDLDGQPAVQSLIYFTTRGAGETDSAKLIKPRVVTLTPANGAVDVDPDIKELRVTFDVPMSSGYSWIGISDPCLKTEKPYWIDDHTCVLPVNLTPGHQYNLALNSDWAIHFQSATGGVPLDPIDYVFTTRN